MQLIQRLERKEEEGKKERVEISWKSESK